MRAAVSALLTGKEFPGPGDGGAPIKFSQVFDEWPTSNDRYVTPAACVLPAGKLVYADARLTPTLLEETWEPRGGAGLGLYALAEGEKDFEVQVRAVSKAERRALVAGIEDLLTSEPGVLTNPRGAKYGVLRPMPEYWGLDVRLSLQDKGLDDTEDAAQKNRWEATFTVRAQALLVKLDTVVPFTVTIREVIE